MSRIMHSFGELREAEGIGALDVRVATIIQDARERVKSGRSHFKTVEGEALHRCQHGGEVEGVKKALGL